jgi:hypothetical protein
MNGYYESSEFEQTLTVMDIKQEDLAFVFNMFDSDGSGEINYHVFAEQLHKLKSYDSRTLLIFIKHYVLTMTNKVNRIAKNVDYLKGTFLSEPTTPRGIDSPVIDSPTSLTKARPRKRFFLVQDKDVKDCESEHSTKELPMSFPKIVRPAVNGENGLPDLPDMGQDGILNPNFELEELQMTRDCAFLQASLQASDFSATAGEPEDQDTDRKLHHNSCEAQLTPATAHVSGGTTNESAGDRSRSCKSTNQIFGDPNRSCGTSSFPDNLTREVDAAGDNPVVQPE